MSESQLITRVELNMVTVTLDNDGRDVLYNDPNYLEVHVWQGRDEDDNDILHLHIGCEGHIKRIGHVKRNGIYAEFIPT
jgi:hypothetical protein